MRFVPGFLFLAVGGVIALFTQPPMGVLLLALAASAAFGTLSPGSPAGEPGLAAAKLIGAVLFLFMLGDAGDGGDLDDDDC